MGQYVLSKGKNVLEAIEYGLHLLGTRKEEVAIEIIQQETKGFLLLGKKQAVVKITKIESPVHSKEEHGFSQEQVIGSELDELDLEKSMELPKGGYDLAQVKNPIQAKELDGKVWVKEGKLFFQPSPYHYPTITVGKGVKLLQNQVLVKGITVASEDSIFELQQEEEVTETKWKVTVDAKGLMVTLSVQPGQRKIYKVKDSAPDDHLHLEAEEIVEVVNDLQYKQILEALEELKVIHGLNHSEILRAVKTNTFGEFTIANGTSPKEGVNGRLELLVDTKMKTGLMERGNGTIDFREIQIIPTVQKGQVVAIVHPHIPGTPGITVTNEPLSPQPTYPLIVRSGTGTIYIESQKKIVATATGRPEIQQKGLLANVSIIPKLVHQGDVNITTGNIRFKGDADILGNIDKGMIVEVPGNILIHKCAFGASVASNTSITIKGNAIRSTISAGKEDIFTAGMVSILAHIHEQCQKMLLSLKQIENLPSHKTTGFHKGGIQPFIKVLLEKKFPSLARSLKQFLEFSEKGRQLLGEEWLLLADHIRACFFSTMSNEFHTVAGMTKLLGRIVEMMEKHNLEKDKACFIELGYAQGSKIYSGGDILIKGKGSYHSTIHAGGSLMINGVLRGGEVYARLGATIEEAGSDGGSTTKISVSSKGTIKIGLAREGTVIQIGKVRHVFHREQRNVVARLDENEVLAF